MTAVPDVLHCGLRAAAAAPAGALVVLIVYLRPISPIMQTYFISPSTAFVGTGEIIVGFIMGHGSSPVVGGPFAVSIIAALANRVIVAEGRAAKMILIRVITTTPAMNMMLVIIIPAAF